jgi:hypothetical protein
VSSESVALRAELDQLKHEHRREATARAEARQGRIAQLHEIYRQEMALGRQFQDRAWQMRNEAEAASDGYVDMRGQYRDRVADDGFGNATNDYRYSQYSEAQKAGKDNAWYMIRAQMDAQMATMHFAKASAIQAEIHRLLMVK